MVVWYEEVMLQFVFEIIPLLLFALLLPLGLLTIFLGIVLLVVPGLLSVMKTRPIPRHTGPAFRLLLAGILIVALYLTMSLFLGGA
jgi:hypothetical protein